MMFGNILKRLPVVLFSVSALSLAAQEAEPEQAPVKAAVQNVPEPSAEEIKSENRKDVDKYSIELGGDESEAKKLVTEAREAFLNDKFEEARDKYIRAKTIYQNLNGFNNKFKSNIEGIDETVSIVYYYWSLSLAKKAEDEMNQNNFKEALLHCKEAKEICPSASSKMDSLIKRIKEKQEVSKYRKDTDQATVMPNIDQKEYNLDVLFEQGKKYLEDGQYDKARDKFEQLLTYNPYHVKAIMYVRFIYDKLYDAGTRRMELTFKERITESEWEYVSPLLPRAFTGEKETIEAPIEKREALSAIEKKLESIIIDHIEFEDTSIPQVINQLRIKSKECDPEGQGVNIFLRLSSGGGGGGSKPAAAEGEEGDAPMGRETAEGEEEPAGEEGEETNLDAEIESSDVGGVQRQMTMIADEIPLKEAIRNLCQGANLKWRIEKYAVVIADQDVPLENFETRIYPLDATDTSMLGEAGGEEGGGEGGGTVNCQGYFAQRGVQFPEGSKIVYDARINRIIATNTPENLQKIENVVKELNVTEPQVLIEAKFVEVSQNDMNSLGFEWLVSKSIPQEYRKKSSMTFNQNDPLMRFSDDVDPAFSNGGDVVFNVVHNASDGVRYQAIVHALETSHSTDILSTPRVTTKNGEEATIRMITEVYLPESWTEAQYLPGGTGTQVIDVFIPSVPEIGEPTETGVTLRVTPTVDADYYTIALDLLPMTQDLVGWIDYSYDVPSPTGPSYRNTIRMPILEQRTIQSPIQVYDGETIVMGGIGRDTNGTIDDQIPVLGDIPVVGRMFQSQVDSSTKRNLLIFTTVRLVQPDGSPYRAREIPGLPPFTQ